MAGGTILNNNNTKINLFFSNKIQITFFKSVYLKKSFFFMETTTIQFDTVANFGTTCTAEIYKPGQFLTNIYVEIELPKLDYQKECNINSNDNFFNIVNDFLEINNKAYRLIMKDIDNYEINTIIELYADLDLVNNFNSIIKSSPFKYSDISLYHICSNVSTSVLKSKLTIIKDITPMIYNYYCPITNKSNKPTWIKNVGTKLIKEITLYINEEQITRFTSEWLTIWNSLSCEESIKKAYFDMINYDKKRSIYVPIPFWFSNLEKALPIYKFKDRIRIEIVFEKVYNLINNYDLITSYLNLNANLLIDYIYTNDILQDYSIIEIDQIEHITFPLKTGSYPLNSFVGISKEIIWSGNIKSSTIKYGDYDRIIKLDSNFYNYVMPYYYHTSNPKKNTNVYSFCLYPESKQITGASNLRIINKEKKVTLDIVVNDLIKDKTFNIYSKTINYLIINNNNIKLLLY